VKSKLAPLHQYLREKRLAAGLTQRDLGNLLGYKPQFITNWERGASSPPARTLSKLVKVLKIPEDELLGILTEQSVTYWRNAIQAKGQRKRA
jgi:transcriptional regulator with XRE-family HTH domain